MRIHHMNCATMCPPFAAAIIPNGRMIAHVLAIETTSGIVLVDSGLGTADCESPRARLGLPFLLAVGPALTQAETALAQLRRLGFSARDVRHIVLTHLDLDHAGGLSDFPDAEVHVLERERASAFGPLPRRHRARYRAAQFAHQPRWRDYAAVGERWFGFQAVRALPGVGPEILLVPLHGHTLGHVGVAVRGDQRWLLHAGDAYFDANELRAGRAAPVLEGFQRLVAMDLAQRLENRARLIELQRTGSVEIFCAHDAAEWARLSAASLAMS